MNKINETYQRNKVNFSWEIMIIIHEVIVIIVFIITIIYYNCEDCFKNFFDEIFKCDCFYSICKIFDYICNCNCKCDCDCCNCGCLDCFKNKSQHNNYNPSDNIEIITYNNNNNNINNINIYNTEKGKNKALNNNIKYDSNSNSNFEVNSLKNKLSENMKNYNKLKEEMEEIKNKLNNQKLNNETIAFNIYIGDENIHFPVSCSPSDIFSTIVQKLYIEFPELKKKKIYFLADGSMVQQNETVSKNKIKNGCTILLNSYE